MHDDLDPTERDADRIRPRPMVDVRVLLGDAAFDEPSDYEEEPESDDEFVVINSRRSSVEEDSCRFSASTIWAAAVALRDGLESNQIAIPRDLGDLEVLRGVNKGPWYRWLDVLRSMPFEQGNQVGRLVLFCCVRPGHRLRVKNVSDHGWTIETIGEPATEFSGSAGGRKIEDSSVPSDSEDERYDERTYGHLESELEETPSVPDDEFNTHWSHYKGPGEIGEVLKVVGLLPKHADELSSTFSESQIARWVAAFGADAAGALSGIKREYGAGLLADGKWLDERFFLLLIRIGQQVVARKSTIRHPKSIHSAEASEGGPPTNIR